MKLKLINQKMGRMKKGASNLRGERSLKILRGKKVEKIQNRGGIEKGFVINRY